MRTDEQRRKAIEYLNRNPEQREKQRIRARAVAAQKRANDPGYRHRADFYARLVEIQGNELCAICGVPPAEGKRLQVDHDHATDEIRGLLCARCNRMLGQALDTEALLVKGVEYLRGRYTGQMYADYLKVPVGIRYTRKDAA